MIIYCNIHGLTADESCPRCEERYWHRALTVDVESSQCWLDPEGDGEEGREEGWSEIKREIQGAINDIWKRHGRIPGHPTIGVGWDDKEEVR